MENGKLKNGANGLNGVNGLPIRTEEKNGVILKTMIPIEKNGV